MNRIRKTIPVLAALVVAAGLLFSACAPPKAPAQTPSTEPATETKTTEPAASDSGSDADSAAFTQMRESVAKSVQANWPRMQKVWPTYDYTKHSLVLFHVNDGGDVQSAWLINHKEARALQPDEWKKIDAPAAGAYHAVEWDGQPSIAMAVDDKTLQEADATEQVYRVATHELVHFYYQEEIRPSMESDRSQTVPADKTPRTYRMMLYKNLIAAYENPDQADQKLAHAKYWLEKWKNDFSEEAKSILSTDIAESTARYTENFATFIGQADTPEAQREHALKNIDRTSIFTSADAESYEIGYVAALILDKQQPDWKTSFYSTGKSVEEVLLEKVAPVEEAMDADTDAAVAAEMDKLNREAEQTISGVIAAKKDTSIPYLRINAMNSNASFSAEGSYRHEDTSILANYASRYEAQGKTIEFNGVQIMETDTGEAPFLVLPLDMPHTIQDGVLTVDTEHVKIDGIRVETSQEGGRTLYTVVVDK